ncbi:molybdopterin-dependent oxidoreductase [Halorussus gelatinilyticus]|uniref:Molybdopterin-dependent oxidoreductase n=1 Tax=Halorussus gelatinilyticus TaxID=2937524 RepID=A0A8U0INN3_9EURY|nr:molybdopterin-dependent oxidoreductase [Halorussus gelatinilyticus]UPW02368.1 molybdopterin-dependent oxidoreductase [Halorussus gelatinilyticus]
MRSEARGLLASALVAGAAGTAAVAGSYAAVGRTPAFVAAPVSEVVIASTPDAVVTWSIQTLGSLGSQLGFLLALALTVGLFALATAVAARLADRFAVPALAVAPVACVAVALALTGSAASTLAAGAGAGLVVALASVGASDADEATTDAAADAAHASARRRVLQAVAGAFAVGGVGAVLGSGKGGDVPETDGEVSAGVQSLLDEAAEKSLDVEGIEPLVSEQFYQVDVNNVDPTPKREDWTLSVTGAVEEETEFDYEDLTGLSESVEHRFVTLRCVGEGLNGKKMDTALWTGVPVTELLDSAGVELGENCCVMLRAADDYFEEFPLSALRDGFLAFEMNGEPLPRGHGYPVRALIPGHWGEINVKWLTKIEVLEEEAKGYWEKRGWHGTGPVNTVAKLHAVNRLGDATDAASGGATKMQVAGHAYAGTRGIRKVEVSTDGGSSWNEATLSEPLPGNPGEGGSENGEQSAAEDAWRQWEHTYEATDAHDVVVRATDGEGNLQPKEDSKPFPSGATGWVSKWVEP